MCRLLGYCARDAAALVDLIGDEGLAQLIALSELHRDGWGMAWYEGSEVAGGDLVGGDLAGGDLAGGALGSAQPAIPQAPPRAAPPPVPQRATQPLPAPRPPPPPRRTP